MENNARLANEAWEALFRAQATVGRELFSADIWSEVAQSEYGVLYALSQAPDGLRPGELSEDVLLSQAGLSRLIGRLEARGLIERLPDPADGRACVLRLSAAGIRKQRRIGAVHGRHVARTLAARLDDAKLVALRDLCRELIAPATSPNKEKPE